MFTLPGIHIQDALESLFTFEWNPRSRCRGIPIESFERWVHAKEEEFGSVQIVISSSWKDAFSLGEIRQKFSSSYLRTRIAATTLTLVGDRAYPRYDEIVAYLESAGIVDEPWVAIDDQRDLFPVGLDNLILVDSEKGFDPVS